MPDDDPSPSGASHPDKPVMPTPDLDGVGAQLHEVLDEVLSETSTGWMQLVRDLAAALQKTDPDNPLLGRPEVRRILRA